MPRTLLTTPLVPLAALGAYLTALGLSDVWHTHSGSTPDLPAVLVIAVALHAAWLVPAVHRQPGLLVVLEWFLTVGFCRVGRAWSNAV